MDAANVALQETTDAGLTTCTDPMNLYAFIAASRLSLSPDWQVDRAQSRTMSRMAPSRSASRAPVASRDVVDLTIERLSNDGAGIARLDGFVVFAQGGLPGDRVRARIGKVRRKFAQARVIEVLENGPDRIVAPCPFHGGCGGCAWQALDYDAQLRTKQEHVEDALSRIGGLDSSIVRPIVPAVAQFGYRNKIEYTFTQDEDGLVAAGFHAAGRWDTVIGVNPCLLADEVGQTVQRVVVDWANACGVEAYREDEEGFRGVLRQLVVRQGRATGQVLVHLVTTDEELPRASELVDDLRSLVPGVVSIIQSRNERVGNTSAGHEILVLWGSDYFEEDMGGVRLRVRPNSFLQTNTEMADVLYELVRETAQPRSEDVVYDLCCGIGSIGLSLANQVEHVYGIEVVDEAIACAVENAAANGIDNVTFEVGNVRPALKHLKEVWPQPTLVIADPPRSGLVRKAIMRMCQAEPERIVYVSCNPSTFAADVKVFAEFGFAPEHVTPVDMFPHTRHVELVALLTPIPGWVETESAADSK